MPTKITAPTTDHTALGPTDVAFVNGVAYVDEMPAGLRGYFTATDGYTVEQVKAVPDEYTARRDQMRAALVKRSNASRDAARPGSTRPDPSLVFDADRAVGP